MVPVYLRPPLSLLARLVTADLAGGSRRREAECCSETHPRHERASVRKLGRLRCTSERDRFQDSEISLVDDSCQEFAVPKCSPPRI